VPGKIVKEEGDKRPVGWKINRGSRSVIEGASNQRGGGREGLREKEKKGSKAREKKPMECRHILLKVGKMGGKKAKGLQECSPSGAKRKRQSVWGWERGRRWLWVAKSKSFGEVGRTKQWEKERRRKEEGVGKPKRRGAQRQKKNKYAENVARKRGKSRSPEEKNRLGGRADLNHQIF